MGESFHGYVSHNQRVSILSKETTMVASHFPFRYAGPWEAIWPRRDDSRVSPTAGLGMA